MLTLKLERVVSTDGDHHVEPIKDQPTSLGDSTSTKEVKEVHAMVQEVTNHALHMLPSLARIWPGFINLLGLATEVIIDCHDHPL